MRNRSKNKLNKKSDEEKKEPNKTKMSFVSLQQICIKAINEQIWLDIEENI